MTYLETTRKRERSKLQSFQSMGLLCWLSLSGLYGAYLTWLENVNFTCTFNNKKVIFSPRLFLSPDCWLAPSGTEAIITHMIEQCTIISQNQLVCCCYGGLKFNAEMWCLITGQINEHCSCQGRHFLKLALSIKILWVEKSAWFILYPWFQRSSSMFAAI